MFKIIFFRYLLYAPLFLQPPFIQLLNLPFNQSLWWLVCPVPRQLKWLIKQLAGG